VEPVARTVITKGLVFDGTGTPPRAAEVTLNDDRVIDATGCTVMPGLIESHGHLTFLSAVGHMDPTFNPPLDVSFFHHIQGMDAELARPSGTRKSCSTRASPRSTRRARCCPCRPR
jgi:imidazolonepropionase-like amidohydrolase